MQLNLELPSEIVSHVDDESLLPYNVKTNAFVKFVINGSDGGMVLNKI